MLKTKTMNYTTLVSSLKTISGLVTEVEIIANAEGLEIVALDPASVALCKFSMPAKLFSEYKITADSGEFKFGVNLKEFNKILSKLAKDSTLILEVDQKINVKIDVKGKFKEFSTGILVLDLKAQKVPDLKFNSIITIAVDDFQDALNDAAIASETATLEVDKNKLFTVTGKGDISQGKTTLMDVTYNRFDKEHTAKAKYSLEYLNNMICKQLGKDVSISLGKDYPIEINYAHESGVKLKFVCAPRIDQD